MESAVNPIRMVLNGGYPPGTEGNPRPYGMPPFAGLMSDNEVAAVVSYIRTGWGKYFNENPTLYKGDFSPGVSVAGAKFLIDSGARVVGNDTLTFEQRPPVLGTPGTPGFQVFPVHMLVIADNGINIIENFYLDKIAAAGEYEFALVVPPLKIRGGTGSALRSFALVP